MKTETFSTSDGRVPAEIEKILDASETGVLVQIFCGEGCDALSQYAAKIGRTLPDAIVVGATTDGEIAGSAVTAERTAIGITRFFQTTLTVSSVEGEDSALLGRQLARSVCTDETQLVLLFSNALFANGETLIKSFGETAPDVPIAGGMAGDNARFERTCICHGEKVMERGVVAVALNSRVLEVERFYRFDWLPVGRKFTITRAEGNRLYSVDHMPAVEFYRHYLGDEAAEELPATAIEFPLMVHRNGNIIARATVRKEPDGSLILAGDIHEGETVQFGFGSAMGALKYLKEDCERLRQSGAETIFVYSCMARRRFVPAETALEISAFANLAPVVGFFTYGEFYRFDENILLNETMTAVALREGERTATEGDCEGIAVGDRTAATKSYLALSHLIEKSSEELNLLLELFDESPIALFEWKNEPDWPVMFASANVEKILGYRVELFRNNTLRYSSLIHPDDLPRVVEEVTDALARKRTEFRHEPYRLKHADGRYIWLDDYTKIRYDKAGEARYFIGYISDVTERIVSQRRLRLYGLMFENASESIVITDEQNRIIAVNPAFEKMTGYRAEDVIGLDPKVLKSGEHDRAFYERMWHSLKTKGEWQGEIHNRQRDGALYIAWLSIRTIHDAKGRVVNYLALQTDITEISDIHQQLEQMAHYDSLTGLPNRLFFKDRIEHAIATHRRQRKRFALLYLDLDNFKNINDTLGHTIGDILLQQVASRLQSILRNSDTVSRQGGDEFLILIEYLDSDDTLERVLKKIITAMERPFAIDKHTIHTSFSIGVARYPKDGQRFEELLQRADLAMYRAKNDGRNRHCLFDHTMLEMLTRKHRMTNELRHALERGELHLCYQPKCHIPTGEMSGAEALLRWENPTLGKVSPAEFIPVAEESGLIIDIGHWILEEACRTIRLFDNRLSIAVNISAVQFNDSGFVERMGEVLERHAVDPKCLELELTESVIIQDVARSRERMVALKDLGLRIAIDDFGTGYSSLSYLKQFPTDVLKIDKNFVDDLNVDRDDAAIVDAIIQLGHIFQMQVVAEGVESVEQLHYLKEHGCDLMQGYLYSKPLQLPELKTFFHDPKKSIVCTRSDS